MTYEEFDKADQHLAECMVISNVTQVSNEEFIEIMSRQMDILVQRHRLCKQFVNQTNL